jgi:hypothetical protein
MVKNAKVTENAVSDSTLRHMGIFDITVQWHTDACTIPNTKEKT